mmetsp:Transcript_8263/g.23569  ORF Transcript_8263/g.23569 Transcript_8263/m.23569 type:complete len:213 (+) Transcript_8263:406-1044(+)
MDRPRLRLGVRVPRSFASKASLRPSSKPRRSRGTAAPPPTTSTLRSSMGSDSSDSSRAPKPKPKARSRAASSTPRASAAASASRSAATSSSCERDTTPEASLPSGVAHSTCQGASRFALSTVFARSAAFSRRAWSRGPGLGSETLERMMPSTASSSARVDTASSQPCARTRHRCPRASYWQTVTLACDAPTSMNTTRGCWDDAAFAGCLRMP